IVFSSYIFAIFEYMDLMFEYAVKSVSGVDLKRCPSPMSLTMQSWIDAAILTKTTNLQKERKKKIVQKSSQNKYRLPKCATLGCKIRCSVEDLPSYVAWIIVTPNPSAD